jgi:hypothetical protein
VFLSASILQREQCKAALSSQKHTSLTRDNRLWIGSSSDKKPDVLTGSYSDSSIIKDIFSLESKIASLGSGVSVSGARAPSQTDVSSSSSQAHIAQSHQVASSQLLSSFISTRQLIDNATTVPGEAPGGYPFAHQHSAGGAAALLDDMPVVLGESYMFLSKAHMGNPMVTDQKGTSAARPSLTSPPRMHSKRVGEATAGSSASTEKLLGTMRRLEQENSQLTTRINELLELERRSEQKQREMLRFREEFASKYGKLKAVLVAYAKKYPHPDNPVVMAWQGQGPSDSAAGGPSPGLVGGTSGSGTFPVDGSEAQGKVIKQLEQTLRGALSRISKLQKRVEEKEKLVAEYENYYRRKKAERTKASGISSGSGSGSSSSGSSNSGGSSSSGSSSQSVGTHAGSALGTVAYVNPDMVSSTGAGIAPRKNAATRTFEASLHRSQT